MPYYKRERGKPLSPREIEVAKLLVEGLGTKEIADKIGLSEHTAKFHVTNIMQKYGVTTRTRAAVMFDREQRAETNGHREEQSW